MISPLFCLILIEGYEKSPVLINTNGGLYATCPFCINAGYIRVASKDLKFKVLLNDIGFHKG